MTDRNWDAPSKLNDSGATTCNHPETESNSWHTTKVSPSQGRRALGYVVVLERVTHSCKACSWRETVTVKPIMPDLADLKRHFKGKVPPKMAQSLGLIQQNGNHLGADIQGYSAVNADPPEEDEGLASFEDEEEAGDDPEDKGEVRVPAAPRDIDVIGAPRKLPQRFWERLPSFFTIKDAANQGNPFPFSSTSDLFIALRAEVHDITGEHSLDHLKASFSRMVARRTKDPEEIKNFLNLLLNLTSEWTPMCAVIAEEYELTRLESGESWAHFNSLVTSWIFDSWLQIPASELYPTEWREKSPYYKPAKKVVAPVYEPEPTAVANTGVPEKAEPPHGPDMKKQAREIRAAAKKVLEESQATGIPQGGPATSSFQGVMNLASGSEYVLEIPGTRVQLVNLIGLPIGAKIIQVDGTLILILGSGSLKPF